MIGKPILNIQTYKTVDRNNAYFYHLDECSRKKYDEEEERQLHHKFPQYIFNSKLATAEDLAFINSPENIIELSVKDHVLAPSF